MKAAFSNSGATEPQTSGGLRRFWRIAWWIAKIVGSILVVYFVVKAIQKGQADIAAQDFDVWSIRWPWLILASISYLLGMIPMGLNWHRLLYAMQQHVPVWDGVRTHFISQLGKYVPGKACVPAIRFALLEKYSLDPPTAFVSMAAETLTMMSVGSVVGGVVVAFAFWSKPQIALLAATFAVVAGLPVIPPVLRFAVNLLQRRKARKTGLEPVDVSGTLTWSVLIPGWLGVVPGWLLLGVSMWSCMKALGLPETNAMTLADLPWVTASYAISVVAGFASMIPGGFGVRELVISELITPKYGATVGLLSAVVHRMTSLMSELVVSGILYISHLRWSSTSADR